MKELEPITLFITTSAAAMIQTFVGITNILALILDLRMKN